MPANVIDPLILAFTDPALKAFHLASFTFCNKLLDTFCLSSQDEIAVRKWMWFRQEMADSANCRDPQLRELLSHCTNRAATTEALLEQGDQCLLTTDITPAVHNFTRHYFKWELMLLGASHDDMEWLGKLARPLAEAYLQAGHQQLLHRGKNAQGLSPEGSKYILSIDNKGPFPAELRFRALLCVHTQMERETESHPNSDNKRPLRALYKLWHMWKTARMYR